MRDVLENLINDLVRHHGYAREDLRLVGQPALIRALRRIGGLPDIPVVMTTRISEVAISDGRYMSDLHIIHRMDVPAWQDTMARRKLYRVALYAEAA